MLDFKAAKNIVIFFSLHTSLKFPYSLVCGRYSFDVFNQQLLDTSSVVNQFEKKV